MKATNKKELEKKLKNEIKTLMKTNDANKYYFYISYDANNKITVTGYQFKVEDEDEDEYYIGTYYNEDGLIDYSDCDEDTIDMLASDCVSDMISNITF